MNNILFDTIVEYKNKDIKLSINDTSVLLEKKRLFIDKYREIDSFDIKDILTYKNKVQIKNNKNSISVKTKNKTYIFNCTSNDSKKIYDLLMTKKTGKTKLERSSTKVLKTSKDVVKAIKAIRGFGTAAMVIAGTISKHKKEFRELYETIKNKK